MLYSLEAKQDIAYYVSHRAVLNHGFWHKSIYRTVRDQIQRLSFVLIADYESCVGVEQFICQSSNLYISLCWCWKKTGGLGKNF